MHKTAFTRDKSFNENHVTNKDFSRRCANILRRVMPAMPIVRPVAFHPLLQSPSVMTRAMISPRPLSRSFRPFLIYVINPPSPNSQDYHQDSSSPLQERRHLRLLSTRLQDNKLLFTIEKIGRPSPHQGFRFPVSKLPRFLFTIEKTKGFAFPFLSY